jgi:hypothetical protein
MLNGLDPILIFQFKKLLPGLFDLGTTKPSIPVVASESTSSFPLPLIPIYLSEKLTGLYIDTETKSIEIDSQAETLSSGDAENINQRGISSTVKIDMIASRDSIGISLLSALTDLIFPKVTSKEYSITYLHGAVTVFNGYLHSFSIDQNSSNDLYKVSLELIKPSALKLPIPVVGKVAGTALSAR